MLMPCFPLDGRPAHHHNTVFFFFSFSQYFRFTFVSCQEDTHCPHFCCIAEFCFALYEERAMRQELYKKKRVRPNEFHAMNLPIKTYFTTLKIAFLQNCENIFKKKEDCASFLACGNQKVHRERKINVPTPSPARMDPDTSKCRVMTPLTSSIASVKNAPPASLHVLHCFSIQTWSQDMINLQP